MARYVVFVQESFDEETNYAPWLAIVEAETPMLALYQYPRYNKMFKQDYFITVAKTPEALGKHWGDTVCVVELNLLLGELLST
jgi:hypothetical protein